jgi:hypothetical protein
MLLTFTVPQTGHIHKVTLKDELVHEYKMTVEEMAKFFSPQLDRQRRAIHNKVAQPVMNILIQELPDEDPKDVAEEARHIVTNFLDSTLNTGRSMLRDLYLSGSLR